ncbi:Hint domain-containing protein [Entomobacter blattae]|uniref:Hint domain protein n=1 Tax=Entomobacter blattae TaxID=2762277 RepID=A0A7H1NTL1_9PROT|nr:Hint domain-containing protein [Entomobacter blattae]QNT79121.1 Hint domain protein [Entomobacter blattae]
MAHTTNTPLPTNIEILKDQQVILNGYDFSSVKNITLNGGSLAFNVESFSKNNFTGTINIGPNGGTIIIDPNGVGITTFPITIRYVDANGSPTNIIPDFRINIQNINPKSIYDPVLASFDGTNTVFGYNQPPLPDVPKPCGPSIIFAGDVFGIQSHTYSTFPGIVYPDGHLGILIHSKPSYPCFLQGTKILTPEGEKTVESLKRGDDVIISKDGQKVTQKITWVGTKTVIAKGEETYPVKISKHALETNVPNEDLLITSEHCLYLNGYLIPARMLVNNRSITIEQSHSSFHIYHIETEQHSLLIANNTLTESFMNTGNKNSFDTAENIITFEASYKQDVKNWETDAAAPLMTERAIVEPIFRMIEQRAQTLGFENNSPEIALTTDTDLHLVTDSGKSLYPTHMKNGWVYFSLPQSATYAYLASHTNKPAKCFGPFVDDRRDLGVCINNIVVTQNKEIITLNSFLTESLPGWSNVEGNSYRWTKGMALLPTLPAAKGTNMRILAVKIQSVLSYPEKVSHANKDLSEKHLAAKKRLAS